MVGLRNRRKKEKENKRNLILRCARKLFFEKGFKNVTVENISRKSDIAKGSIYLHFKSKEDIYSQILLNDIKSFHRKVVSLPASGIEPAAMLCEFCRIYVEFFLNEQELFRILMNFMLHTEHMNLPEETHAHLVKMTNRSAEITEKILTYGIERGDFSPSLNTRQMRNAIWGLMNGIISLHLFTGAPQRREEKIRTTVQESLEVLLAGLSHGAAGKRP